MVSPDISASSRWRMPSKFRRMLKLSYEHPGVRMRLCVVASFHRTRWRDWGRHCPLLPGKKGKNPVPESFAPCLPLRNPRNMLRQRPTLRMPPATPRRTSGALLETVEKMIWRRFSTSVLWRKRTASSGWRCGKRNPTRCGKRASCYAATSWI